MMLFMLYAIQHKMEIVKLFMEESMNKYLMHRRIYYVENQAVFVKQITIALSLSYIVLRDRTVLEGLMEIRRVIFTRFLW